MDSTSRAPATDRWAEMLEAHRSERETHQLARPTRGFPKPKSLGHEPLSHAEKEEGKRLRHLRVIQERPRTRGECKDAPRPCPWISCRHHLYIDVNPHNGSLRLNFPGVDLEDMADTCSLDVADRGPNTLDGVGHLINVVMERSRQIEEDSLHSAEVEIRLRWGPGGREQIGAFVKATGNQRE